MVPALFASALLLGPSQDPALPPIGPQGENEVQRYAIDNNLGGHSHVIKGRIDHVWPNGLCPTGELYVTRKGSQSLAIKGFDGFPHLRRDCDTGQWIVIPGIVLHQDIGLEVERNANGQVSTLMSAFEHRIPDPRIPVPGTNEIRAEPSDFVSKDKLGQYLYISATASKNRLLLHRRDTMPLGHKFGPDQSLDLAETQELIMSGVDLLVGNPERLRNYYKRLRDGKRVDLCFLEADLKLHAFHLVGLGCQQVTYKSWTKTLFRADLRLGDSSSKKGRFAGWLWFDEKGGLQVGQATTTFDLMPIMGFVSPRSEAADNGRPWPVFVPPTTFVPAPPEFKPPTDGDGGGGNR